MILCLLSPFWRMLAVGLVILVLEADVLAGSEVDFHPQFRSPVSKAQSGTEFKAAWGVDACLSSQFESSAISEWLILLKASGVRVLRERSTGTYAFDPKARDYRIAYRQAKEAGFKVVAFGRETAKLPGVNKRWGLSDDPAAVFEEGRRIGRDYAEYVDVWELHNEPDVGYVPDLPDRYASHGKSLYLGLKAGAREAGYDTPVILGALALPPGPWMERAMANDVLDYADAYNLHFYGYAEHLTSVIDAHRAAMRASLREKVKLKRIGRPAGRAWYQGPRLSALSFPLSARQRMLPFWITECGTNATVPGDFFNAERRAYQAEFTLSTARQALAAKDVAVFMPFILVHKGDPHALVTAENIAPLPAWEAYAHFTRENPWPPRKLFEPAGARANPVVVQWLPDEGTRSHKVAGAYRVGEGGAVSGRLRVFNFGNEEAVGNLKLEAGNLKAEGGAESENSGLSAQVSGLSSRHFDSVALHVPPMGHVEVPVVFTPAKARGYFREGVSVRFRERSGRTARAAFGIERVPQESDFEALPLALRRLEGESLTVRHPIQNEGEPAGPWRVFNEIRVDDGNLRMEGGGRRPDVGNLKFENGRLEAEGAESENSGLGSQVSGLDSASAFSSQPSTWRFSIGEASGDPLAPTYAVAALDGVPRGAQFLRLTLDKPMRRGAFMRVDLIDADGQRFTIWENMGMVYGAASTEVWLGLADFHPYFWSTTVPGKYRIDPRKVRELQLRFYFQSNEAMEVGLEWRR